MARIQETAIRIPGKLFTSIAALTLAIACVPPDEGRAPRVESPLPDVWAAAPSYAIESDHPAGGLSSPYFDRENRVIHVAAASGETAGFQIVLEGGKAGAVGIRISAADFTGPGTIPRDRTTLYRQWPVRVERFHNWYFRSVGHRRQREVPDVLIPIDAPRQGQPFNIAAGDSLLLWCDVDIPAGVPAGEYTGAIVLQSADGMASRVGISLDVRDLGLTGADRLPVFAWVQVRPIVASATSVDPDNTRQVLSSPEVKTALYDACRLLREHGLSPLTNDIKPPFEQDQSGRVVIDWSRYDALIGPLIDGAATGGTAAAAWPLPVDENYPDPTAYGGATSATYGAVLKSYLAECATHFEQRGWLKNAFVYFDLPASENPTEAEVERIRQLATLTHLVRGDLPFATRLAPQPMEQFGWHEQAYVDLTSLVDIWATPARYEHPPTLKRLQTLGKRTWFFPDRPPFSGSLAVEAPLVHARSLPAQAFLMNHGALFIQKSTDWPADLLESPIDENDEPSDAWLIYPGSTFGVSGAVPSLRLKQLELGIGDCRRMALLDQKGRGETARLVARSLIKAAGTESYGDNYQDALPGRRVDDAEAWDLARRILDEELSAAMHGIEPAEIAAGAGRGKWSKLLAMTRRIEAWFEGARLQHKTRGAESQYVLSFDMAVRNDLPLPLEGVVNFGSLPPQARRVSDTVQIGPIEPFKLGRGSIVMASPVLPDTTYDGHLPQELIFDAGTSGTVVIDAAASIAQVISLDTRPEVDGRLDEWPPASVNAASDFRLITGGAAPDRRRQPPKSETIVYFARFDDTFYIAMAAQAPAPASAAPPKRTLRNFVEYRDLMPVGEDLIEIMIDPTNRGVVPGDLFHIVVKSSGNPKFERGVEMTPPIGDVGPWPGAQPQCTVRQTSDGWAAELAIPLAAFGEEAAHQRVWGLNVARLEPARGEYSDWATAPRYCYDPRTLGNLVWPE